MGQFLGESQSRIYPNMCAKFCCGPTVVSKIKEGVQTDRQRDTADFYSRCDRILVKFNCKLEDCFHDIFYTFYLFLVQCQTKVIRDVAPGW